MQWSKSDKNTFLWFYCYIKSCKLHSFKKFKCMTNQKLKKLYDFYIFMKCNCTLQMFYMLFLQSYVCQPNPQTTLSNFNSLKPVIKKRQFNAVFTVFHNGFLHAFVCNFWKLFSVISAAYMKQILKEIVIFFYRWMYVENAMK